MLHDFATAHQFWMGCIVGGFIGVFFGWFIMALLVISRERGELIQKQTNCNCCEKEK